VQIKNRVKRLEFRKANELRPNPAKLENDHPVKQLDAIRAIFDEVGFAGVELARKLDDGPARAD
jgi:hypothetical protein